jgi:hypothetical protein
MPDRASREATLSVSVILHQEWGGPRLALLIPMRQHASLNWLLHLGQVTTRRQRSLDACPWHSGSGSCDGDWTDLGKNLDFWVVSLRGVRAVVAELLRSSSFAA